MTKAFCIEQRGNPDIGDLQRLDDVRFVAGATNILASTDLTVESRRVVNYAAILAKSCGAHLTILHVNREPYNVAYLRGSPAYLLAVIILAQMIRILREYERGVILRT